MSMRNLGFVIAALIAGAGFSSRTLAGGLNSKVEKELEARINYVYGSVWQKQDANAFVKEFFTPDAVVTASNSATTWHGEKQIAGIIKQVMEDIKDLHATVVWTRPVGTRAAAQFVTFKLEARDPAKQKDIGESGKALYAWEKTPAGWRVVADHSAYVGMDAPN
jgi:hypothetical protein